MKAGLRTVDLAKDVVSKSPRLAAPPQLPPISSGVAVHSIPMRLGHGLQDSLDNLAHTIQYRPERLHDCAAIFAAPNASTAANGLGTPSCK